MIIPAINVDSAICRYRRINMCTIFHGGNLLADPGGAGITLNGVAPDGPLVRLLQGDGAPTVVANGSNAATTLVVVAERMVLPW